VRPWSAQLRLTGSRWRCGRDNSDANLDQAYKLLIATRPTAINLKWALDEMARVPSSSAALGPRRRRAYTAPRNLEEDVASTAISAGTA